MYLNRPEILDRHQPPGRFLPPLLLFLQGLLKKIIILDIDLLTVLVDIRAAGLLNFPRVLFEDLVFAGLVGLL